MSEKSDAEDYATDWSDKDPPIDGYKWGPLYNTKTKTWRFYNEGWQELIGPYNTREEATEAMLEYHKEFGE